MPSKLITDCVPELQTKWPKIYKAFMKACDKSVEDLLLSCTHRPPEEQYQLFKQGRTMDIHGVILSVDRSKIVTNDDGTNNVSPHNFYPSRAIDVVVKLKSGDMSWSPKYFNPLQQICDDLDLVWGGSWKSINDFDHIEVKNYKHYEA